MSNCMVLESTKACSKCKRTLPATLEFFAKQAAAKDGLYRYCKTCSKEYSRNRKQTARGRAVSKRADEKYRTSTHGKAVIKRRHEVYYATVRGHLQHIFHGMISRCTNPNNTRSYPYYGGRGIKVCFESADEFIDYVVNVLRVDPRGLTIDRIDGDGNYEPGNIRFVTQAVNNQNRRGAGHG